MMCAVAETQKGEEKRHLHWGGVMPISSYSGEVKWDVAKEAHCCSHDHVHATVEAAFAQGPCSGPRQPGPFHPIQTPSQPGSFCTNQTSQSCGFKEDKALGVIFSQCGPTTTVAFNDAAL